jgi:hypothetical protein
VGAFLHFFSLSRTPLNTQMEQSWDSLLT